MASRNDGLAQRILLAVALAIGLFRWFSGGPDAPGAIAFRGIPDDRPVKDSVAATAVRMARPLARGDRIDVNRADANELTRLPRIGPALAARIVADREARGGFAVPTDLERVPGIGPALRNALEPHVTFGGTPPVRPGSSIPTRISINRAAEADLARLPGVGPVRARAIVEYRQRHGPFRSIDDLAKIKGIGPATVERLRAGVSLS